MNGSLHSVDQISDGVTVGVSWIDERWRKSGVLRPDTAIRADIVQGLNLTVGDSEMRLASTPTFVALEH